jgi:hypothetical protein
MAPILSHLNTVHILILADPFNITLTSFPRSPKWSLPISFLTTIFYTFLYLPYVLHTPPIPSCMIFIALVIFHLECKSLNTVRILMSKINLNIFLSFFVYAYTICSVTELLGLNSLLAE